MTPKIDDINLTKLVLERKVTEDDLLHIRDNMGKTLQELDLSKASFEGNEIRGDVFADCSGLISITFPNTVIEVDLLSLKSCNNLATITVEPGNPVLASENGVLFNDVKTLLIFYPNARQDDKGYVIPDTVTKIETFAFFGCRHLTSVFIPASVTEMLDHVFNGCPNLTEITVHPDNPAYASENGMLLNKDKTELIYYPEGRQGECIIPDTVVKIGHWAFSGSRKGLNSVKIPASTVDFNIVTFFDCVDLTDITIHPENPEYKGKNGIEFCEIDADFTLPDTYKEISEYFIEIRIIQHQLSNPAFALDTLDDDDNDDDDFDDDDQDSIVFENGEEEEKRYYSSEEVMENLRKKMSLDTKLKLTPELRLEQALIEAKVEDIAIVRKLTVVGNMTASDLEYINSNLNETLQELNISDASLEGNIIASGALSNCDKLTCVSISATVTEIADDAFGGSVTTITVQPDNPVYKSENGKLIGTKTKDN